MPARGKSMGRAGGGKWGVGARRERGALEIWKLFTGSSGRRRLSPPPKSIFAICGFFLGGGEGEKVTLSFFLWFSRGVTRLGKLSEWVGKSSFPFPVECIPAVAVNFRFGFSKVFGMMLRRGGYWCMLIRNRACLVRLSLNGFLEGGKLMFVFYVASYFRALPPLLILGSSVPSKLS